MNFSFGERGWFFLSLACAFFSATTAALAKAIATKDLDAIRCELPEGTSMEVDMLVQIQGTLTVGKSAETTQVASLQPWRLFLAALSMLNGVSIDCLIRMADDMSAADEKAQKVKVMSAAERLKGKVRITRAAPIKFDGIVEGID